MLCLRCTRLFTSSFASTSYRFVSTKSTVKFTATIQNQRRFYANGPSPTVTAAQLPSIETPSKLKRGLFDVMQRFEDIIGITAVKEAQGKVVLAESQFTQRQEERREIQSELKLIQMRLKEIHTELDRTSRGEDRYLSLLTKEHEFVKREKQILDTFQNTERDERAAFHRLSMFLRESHEKERERGERTKYWSIIGSIIGATIGILGTTINNRMRMRELRDLVHDSSDPVKVQGVIQQLTDMIQQQQNQVQLFILDVKAMLHGTTTGAITHVANEQLAAGGTDQSSLTEEQLNAILAAIQKQESQLDGEMDQLKKLIAVEHGYTSTHSSDSSSIVYVGPEMSSLLEQSIADLEWRMKLQTLLNVVAVYGGLAVLVPVMYAIFKGQ